MKSQLRIALCALAPVCACSASDEDEHVTPPECDEIAHSCHGSTTAQGMECHENAHEVWTAAECMAMEAVCLGECAVH